MTTTRRAASWSSPPSRWPASPRAAATTTPPSRQHPGHHRPGDHRAPTARRQTAPERIVSLSPTATEMLFAVGAGDQVVAVDDQSNFPEGAPTTDLSGFKPNVEAIVGYEPDLVVLSDDADGLVAGLEASSASRSCLQPAADHPRRHLRPDRRAGDGAPATTTRAPTLVAEMRADIDELAGLRPGPRRGADLLPRARRHALHA